jgi:selenocysteine lyase/cysteine desulfurase
MDTSNKEYNSGTARRFFRVSSHFYNTEAEIDTLLDNVNRLTS